MRDQDIVKEELFDELNRLREEKNCLANLLDAMTDGCFILDKACRFKFLNEKALQRFNRAREELMGQNIWNLYPEAKKSNYYGHYQSLLKSNHPVQFIEYYPPTNQWFNININTTCDGLMVYFNDITPQKKIENTLSETDTKMTNILDSISDAFFALDNKWRFTYINKAAEDFLMKASKDTLLGVNIWEAYPRLINTIYYDKYHEAFNYKVPVHFEAASEYGISRFSVSVYPGKEGLTVYYQDITDRKLMEEKLQASEDRFYKMFHLSPDIMVLSEIDTGKYVNVNESYLNCFGYQREEVIGRTSTELIFEPGIREGLVDILKKNGFVQNEEVTAYGKSGEKRTLLLSADTLDIGGQAYLLTSSKDITKQKHIERELARLERLNLIGQMSASIGHEIRNPLTTIRGFLQMLELKELNIVNKEYYALMIQELDRANTILSEFLSLAQDKNIKYTENNLNGIVETLFPLMWGDAIKQDKDIIVETGEIPILFLNENEIRQLILNLVRNGLEASEAGKRLYIKTFVENHEVVLSVKDEGSGICDDMLEKLGTPFVTTKSQGTGLGLAVCYSIVNKHDATIDVRTGSTGTTFSVRFKYAFESVDERKAI